MLLAILCKVLLPLIIERLKDALDHKLRCEWTGFRKDKSCADHITSMRIIIEQPKERQTPLYMNFIDFR